MTTNLILAESKSCSFSLAVISERSSGLRTKTKHLRHQKRYIYIYKVGKRRGSMVRWLRGSNGRFELHATSRYLLAFSKKGGHSLTASGYVIEDNQVESLFIAKCLIAHNTKMISESTLNFICSDYRSEKSRNISCMLAVP